MKHVNDVAREMPELSRLFERLDDPEWPTREEVARSFAALCVPKTPGQGALDL